MPAYIAIAVLAALTAVVFVVARVRARSYLVAARMATQAAFLLLFLFLLTQTVVPIEGYLALRGVLPVDLFVRLSPILAFTAMVATGTIVAGMLLSLVTLLSATIAGRWFCGWICPLGTTFDITDRALFHGKKRPQERDSSLRGAKYLILAAVLVAAVFGAQTAGWFDPMSILTRSYGTVVLPLTDRMASAAIEEPLSVEAIRNGAAGAGLRRAGARLDELNITSRQERFYVQFGVFAVILVGLVAAQAYQKRFWCRKLCPLGALLGAVSGRRPVGVHLTIDDCVHCGKCSRICPVGAVQDTVVVPQECTVCGVCVVQCPTNALHAGLKGKAAGKDAPAMLPGRRALLAAAAAGIVSAPVLAANTQRRAGQAKMIRPPGAQDEDRFLDACVRCGECMKACPQNALHPTGFQAGLEGLWTPRIVPVLGYCDFNCLAEDAAVGNFCSTVCPTGAIRRLTPAEHRAVKRGTAYFRTDRCIPYVERTECSVCVEHCPVPKKALKNEIVEVVDLQTGQTRQIQRPWVDKHLCIGCGQCEFVCPLKGEKGIRVEPVRSTT